MEDDDEAVGVALVPYLNDDLIMNILSRFHEVKWLIRFKCVCKSWYSLISSSTFVDMHLLRTNNNNNNTNQGRYLLYFAKDNTCRTLLSLFFFNYHIIKIYSSMRFDDAKLVGVCNGLLCLVTDDYHKNFHFHLVNPATKQSRVLEKPNIVIPIGISSYGFAFDSKANDYKVVWVTSNYEKSKLLVLVLALKTKCWRTVSMKKKFEFVDHCSNTVVENTLHWIGRTPQQEHDYDYSSKKTTLITIVAFDLVDEIFRDFKIPEDISDQKKCYDHHCFVFKGNLCVSVAPKFGFCIGDEIQVWVMKQYGVEESWSKDYCFSGTFLNFSLPTLLYHNRIGIRFDYEWNNLRNRKDLSYFFNEEIISENLKLHPLYGRCFIDYRESLVQV
ncbi:F-box protein At3g07870-like [Humulus lupulus]|uniref:F-box protein At3g07870-like n=1 Tax=Humulus lupulus TaxID=3486 RepID=UPI002B414C71|nr:F-box protein At3g07870-like [Humulus lupulus]